MYKAMRFFRSIWVAPFLFVLVATQMIPDGILELFPADCLEQLESDLLPCAISNLCFSLLPTDEELAAIPTSEEIESCVDVDTALCPITTRCPACKEKADDVFKCVILKSEIIPQNITDLVSGCTLSCIPEAEPSIVGSSYCTYGPDMDCFTTGWPACCDDDPIKCPDEQPLCEVPSIVAATDAPADVPIDAPVVPPSEAPEPVEATPAPTVSGTVSIMTSTVGTIAGLTTLFLSL